MELNYIEIVSEASKYLKYHVLFYYMNLTKHLATDPVTVLK